MGCNGTKIVPIPELASPSTFDQLPVEIIYKILDELDISTIYVSLYHVSKRLDNILSTYHKYHIDLKTISLNNFKLIHSYIRPEQVTKLTLSDDENSSGLLKLFLSHFSIHSFVRLQSLTLIEINNEELINQILIPLTDHASFLNFSSIKIINSDEIYGDIFVELIMSVLIRPLLRRVYFDISSSRTTFNPLPWLLQCSFRHITFKSDCSVDFVRNLFACTPELETFEADDFDFEDETDLNNVPDNNEDHNNSNSTEEAELEVEENPNNEDHEVPRNEKFASIESTNHLKSLILNKCSMNMSKIEWMLQEISALKRFRLITTTEYDDESILDGQRWAALISNMDNFEFIFSVNLSDSFVLDVDSCIATFRTPFWTNDKQWFVSLEKYDEEITLYTLPYINYFYVMKNPLSSFEYRSTAVDNSKLQSQSMNNVHDLYIDTSSVTKSEIENTFIPYFSHATHLFLYGRWPKSKTFISTLKTIVNLNVVEELIREEYIPTMEFISLVQIMPNLQSIKTSTNFLDALNAAKFSYKKCLRSLIINTNNYAEQRPVNIEPFCAMFPRIRYLNIPVDSVDSCQYLLEQLNRDLISITFRIIANYSFLDETDNETDNENESDEQTSTVNSFAEWIRELPEQYHYYKKQQQIHIWLQ